MEYRFFFFLALIKLCFASVPDETHVAPDEKVFSFFSQLLTKINCNSSFIISDDYDKINDLHNHSLLDCMLSLIVLGDIRLVYVFCLALQGFSIYTRFKDDLKENPAKINQKKSCFYFVVQKIFLCLNRLIFLNLKRKFTLADAREKEWNDRKKLVCTMLSILEQYSFYSEPFLMLTLYPFNYRRKISPRTSFRIMSSLIEDIEMDFESAAYKTFIQLQRLSKRYAGQVPKSEPIQQKIFTLINLFRLYSHHIIIFSPSSLNLNNCTPKFLALLIESSDYEGSMEGLFTLINSDSVISNASNTLYWKLFMKNIYLIVRKHRLKIDTNTSFGLTVFQEESPDDQWLLLAYLKLSLFLSKNIAIKNVA